MIPRPARPPAAATICVTPPALRARWGALTRTKTVRSMARSRPAPAQIGDHRVTDVGRQRQPLGLVSLPSDDDRRRPANRGRRVEARRVKPRAIRGGRAWSGARSLGVRSGCAAITGLDKGPGSRPGPVPSAVQPVATSPRRAPRQPAAAQSSPSTWRKPSSDRKCGHRQFRGATRLSRCAGDHEGAHVGGPEGTPVQG